MAPPIGTVPGADLELRGLMHAPLSSARRPMRFAAVRTAARVYRWKVRRKTVAIMCGHAHACLSRAAVSKLCRLVGSRLLSRVHLDADR